MGRFGNLWPCILIWAVDDEDDSCWLGGIQIDKSLQGKGFGKAAIMMAMDLLREQNSSRVFALSYEPDNPAKKLYEKIGFLETGEREDEEVVARLIF